MAGFDTTRAYGGHDAGKLVKLVRNYLDQRMNEEWQEALAPLGTDHHKEFLEIAPWIVVLFEQRYGIRADGTTRHHYYVKESCGIAAGMFHLFTHAFFKALLFLGAGSVMHAMGDVIDMRRFSGLKHALPITHWTFLVGAAALAGVPLLAGFWSKDDIIAVLQEASHVVERQSRMMIDAGAADFRQGIADQVHEIVA